MQRYLGLKGRRASHCHAGYANYDQCLDGRLRLVPDDELPALQSDYDAMRAATTVGDDAPGFGTLIEEIRNLEANANMLAHAPRTPRARRGPQGRHRDQGGQHGRTTL